MLRKGKLAENVYKRSVEKQVRTLNNKSFGKKSIVKGAIKSASGQAILDGRGAFVKAFNEVYARGFEIAGVDISILMPKESEERELKSLINSISSYCSGLNIIINDIEVTVTGDVNKIIITTNAYGCALEKDNKRLIEEYRLIDKEKLSYGDYVLLTKWIGITGSQILVNSYRDILEKSLSASFIDRIEDFKNYELIDKEMRVINSIKGLGITGLYPLSDGGVFAGLWDMAGLTGCGLDIDLRSIPVRQETIEICEILNVNPYELMSDGAMLIVCRDAEKVIDALYEAGIKASLIGRLTDNNDKIIRNSDEIRYLEPAKTDAVYTFYQTGERLIR